VKAQPATAVSERSPVAAVPEPDHT
jgi:hypothetical protein